jgi:hypothetical protein
VGAASCSETSVTSCHWTRRHLAGQCSLHQQTAERCLQSTVKASQSVGRSARQSEGHAHACSRLLTPAHARSRLLTPAHACSCSFLVVVVARVSTVTTKVWQVFEYSGMWRCVVGRVFPVVSKEHRASILGSSSPSPVQEERSFYTPWPWRWHYVLSKRLETLAQRHSATSQKTSILNAAVDTPNPATAGSSHRPISSSVTAPSLLCFPVSSKSFRLLTARQPAVSPGISFVKESEICTQGCVQSLVCNKRPRSLLPGTLEPCISLLVVCRSAWLGSEVCCQMVMAVVAAKVLETGVL